MLPVLPHQLPLFSMEPDRGECSLPFLHNSELPHWAWQESGSSHLLQLPSIETMWQLVYFNSFLPSRHWVAEDPYWVVTTARQWHQLLPLHYQHTNRALSPWGGFTEGESIPQPVLAPWARGPSQKRVTTCLNDGPINALGCCQKWYSNQLQSIEATDGCDMNKGRSEP